VSGTALCRVLAKLKAYAEGRIPCAQSPGRCAEGDFIDPVLTDDLGVRATHIAFAAIDVSLAAAAAGSMLGGLCCMEVADGPCPSGSGIYR
jgi:hypothetical protein